MSLKRMQQTKLSKLNLGDIKYKYKSDTDLREKETKTDRDVFFLRSTI